MMKNWLLGSRTFLISFAVTVIAACTSLPTKDFTSYKEAFANARTAGESVILDYGSAMKKEQIVRQSQKAATESKPTSGRNDNFNPIDAASVFTEIDHIAVRIAAWEVVSRYNDVLTTLAEGKSAQEVAGTVDGLYESLTNFPLDKIAEATGSISPFINAFKTLVTASETERSKKQFITIVNEVGPKIRNGFLMFLIDDTKNYSNIRKTQNDREYRRFINQGVTPLSRRFKNLAEQYKPDDNVAAITSEINALRKSIAIPGGDISLQSSGSVKVTAMGLSQLEQIRDDIKQNIEAAKAKTTELNNYQTMLVSYVKLIRQVDLSLQALERASDSATVRIPSNESLVAVYIELRQSMQTYRDSRGS